MMTKIWAPGKCINEIKIWRKMHICTYLVLPHIFAKKKPKRYLRGIRKKMRMKSVSTILMSSFPAARR